VPVAWVCGDTGHPEVGLAITLISFIAGIYWQRALQEQMRQCLRVSHPQSIDYDSGHCDLPSLDVSDDWTKYLNMSFTSLITMALTFIDYTDPSQDALTAGRYTRFFSQDMDCAFSRSWDGQLVGGASFSRTLNLLLCTVTSIQALCAVLTTAWASSMLRIIEKGGSSMGKSKQLEKGGSPTLRIVIPELWFWQMCANAAECGSLGLTSKTCAELLNYLIDEYDVPKWSPGFEKYIKVTVKGLIENMISTHLQITGLGLSLVFDSEDKLGLCLSTFSVVTSLGGLAAVAKDLVGGIKDFRRRFGGVGGLFGICAAPTLACFVVLFVLESVRLVGIFRCPGHEFLLSTVSCSNFTCTE